MEDVFGHECLYLTAAQDGDLAAVLPLVRVRSRLFGHYLVSMPFLNYGGPLGRDDGISALVDAATEEAESSGADLLELRSRMDLDLSLPPSRPKVTVVLDLQPGDPSATWSDFKSKVRSQVRRPRKEGVEVRFGREQLEPFYAVFSRHMRDLGTPVLPRSLFSRMVDAFGEDVWFACAYLEDKPVAAGCGLRWGSELEMTWAAALREYSRIAPNMLLYWSFIERCAQLGLQRFNFGRCTPGGGTHRFKSQWGGRDEKLWWYAVSHGRKESTPSPDDSRWSWGPKIWSRLPLGLTRWLGPRVAKQIP